MSAPYWIYLWLLPTLAADLVAIESDVPDPQLAQIAIESCNAALGAGRCRRADEPGAAATWIVRVTWEAPEHVRARVEIRRASEPQALDSVRVVEFSAADDAAERQRAIGLIVAAYVIERTPRTPAPAPAEATQAPAAPASDAAAEPEDELSGPAPRMPRWAADLALLGGPGLDRGAARFGIMLRGLARPFEAPLAALLSLRAARRFDDDPTLLWMGAGAGLALRLRTGPALAFEVRGEFAFERLHAEAREADSSREDRGGAYRLGGRLGLEAHVALGARTALFAGGELNALSPRVYLDVGGSREGQDRPLNWGGLAGLRLTD